VEVKARTMAHITAARVVVVGGEAGGSCILKLEPGVWRM